MKKTFFSSGGKVNVIIKIIMIMLLPALGACSKGTQDEPEPTPTPSPTPDEPELTLSENELYGTWKSTYATSNIDYFAFDENGKGMFAVLADQYHWETFSGLTPDMCNLVYCTYSVHKNVITIYPDNGKSPFTITISQGNAAEMAGRVSVYDHPFNAKKISKSYSWFTEQGPASVDLTTGLTGLYINEEDRLDKREVVRVNNYTLNINGKIGYLSYEELNSDEREVHEMNSYIHYFTKDGKLHIWDMVFSK